MRIKALALAVLLCIVALPTSAKSPRLMSPLDKLETIEGPVEIRSEGTTVFLIPSAQGVEEARVYKVDLEDRAGLPDSFHSRDARIQYWRGHLVLVARDQGKAWSFSIPDPVIPAGARLVETPDAPAVEDSLKARYDLISLPAAAISSMGGPRALQMRTQDLRSAPLGQIIEIDNPDPGGGVGSCGTTCNITCGDGSNCSVNCSSRRCASCICPASCSCK